MLAKDTAWAKAGHEIAWGQSTPNFPAAPSASASVAPSVAEDAITLGPATFSTKTGQLTSLNGLAVSDCRVDIYRAPTDNDVLAKPSWDAAGFDRMHEYVESYETTDKAFVVETRLAAADTDRYLALRYEWTADSANKLRLDLHEKPVGGDWDTLRLPRFGVRLALPQSIERVRWLGKGPGESYPDTGDDARLGVWDRSVDELQTPYVFPQENGNRSHVRWAELSGPDGGLRVTGAPEFNFSARRWESSDLAAARHTPDLVPRDHVWVNLDASLDGIGSGSCGPQPLPAYLNHAKEGTFSVSFAAL